MQDTLTAELREKKYSDAEVGSLALISMYMVMLFLILQIPVLMLVGGACFILSQMGTLTDSLSAIIFLVTASIIDITMITVLSYIGLRTFKENVMESRAELNKVNPIEPEKNGAVFTETHLEIAIMITALVSLAWCRLQGMPPLSLHIVLLAVEGFSSLFMAMFIFIRFLATREIKPLALATLALTVISLVSLVKFG